jgi:glycosyltransferase involved in cell wall biosynthesis
MTDKPVLVIAYDRLGPRHAGPAIRSLALAGEIGRTGPVTVVYEGEAPVNHHAGIEFVSRESITVDAAFFSGFRAVLAPPLVAMVMPELLESDVPVIIDLFDPVIWENLELYKSETLPERNFQHERHLAAVTAGLIRGDFFLVAGRRQQDLSLGALMALNRINPETWIPGRGPGQMVGLVPFGLPDKDPPSSSELPYPAEFKSNGPLVVWGGGMWDWLKPDMIVRAWPDVLKKFPNARLAFPGTKHPNPHVPEPEMVGLARQLASRLKVAHSVIFGGWLPRDEYLGVLARAACGVSAHSPGLESRYAVRTRFLDAIWMGAPQVVSGGDEYSDYVAENNLGVVVPGDDPIEFGKAIIRAVDSGRGAYAGNFEHARNELVWSRMAIPLMNWLKDPRLTHGKGIEFFQSTVGGSTPRSRPSDPGSLLRRVLSKLKR